MTGAEAKDRLIEEMRERQRDEAMIEEVQTLMGSVALGLLLNERRARVAEKALELAGVAQCPMDDKLPCPCPDNTTCNMCLMAWCYAVADEAAE